MKLEPQTGTIAEYINPLAVTSIEAMGGGSQIRLSDGKTVLDSRSPHAFHEEWNGILYSLHKSAK